MNSVLDSGSILDEHSNHGVVFCLQLQRILNLLVLYFAPLAGFFPIATVAKAHVWEIPCFNEK